MSERDWNWERQLHGIIPPLISPLDDAGAPGERMVSLLKPGPGTPVYLQAPMKLFTLAPLPKRGLYIGLTHNADGDEELSRAAERLMSSGPPSSKAIAAAKTHSVIPVGAP